MILRYFKVRCDYCGLTINHYPKRKPNNYLLCKDGIVHTNTKQFCSNECNANWNHDRQANQYWNLLLHGKIHNNEKIIKELMKEQLQKKVDFDIQLLQGAEKMAEKVRQPIEICYSGGKE